MKENVDELSRLFNEGKHALDQFERFHSAVVPNRIPDLTPKIGTGRYGLPYTYYDNSTEPEHPKTAELLQTARKHVTDWIVEVNYSR